MERRGDRQASWGVQGCLETGDPTNIPGESETYPKKPQRHKLQVLLLKY